MKSYRRRQVYPRVRRSVEFPKVSNGCRLISITGISAENFSGCFYFEKQWKLTALYMIIVASSKLMRKCFNNNLCYNKNRYFSKRLKNERIMGKEMSVRPSTW